MYSGLKFLFNSYIIENNDFSYVAEYPAQYLTPHYSDLSIVKSRDSSEYESIRERWKVTGKLIFLGADFDYLYNRIHYSELYPGKISRSALRFKILDENDNNIIDPQTREDVHYDNLVVGGYCDLDMKYKEDVLRKRYEFDILTYDRYSKIIPLLENEIFYDYSGTDYTVPFTIKFRNIFIADDNGDRDELLTLPLEQNGLKRIEIINKFATYPAKNNWVRESTENIGGVTYKHTYYKTICSFKPTNDFSPLVWVDDYYDETQNANDIEFPVYKNFWSIQAEITELSELTGNLTNCRKLKDILLILNQTQYNVIVEVNNPLSLNYYSNFLNEFDGGRYDDIMISCFDNVIFADRYKKLWGRKIKVKELFEIFYYMFGLDWYISDAGALKFKHLSEVYSDTIDLTNYQNINFSESVGELDYNKEMFRNYLTTMPNQRIGFGADEYRSSVDNFIKFDEWTKKDLSWVATDIYEVIQRAELFLENSGYCLIDVFQGGTVSYYGVINFYMQVSYLLYKFRTYNFYFKEKISIFAYSETFDKMTEKGRFGQLDLKVPILPSEADFKKSYITDLGNMELSEYTLKLNEGAATLKLKK